MTIVVLLILAGITITYVFGENSIFNQASRAKEQTAMEKAREKLGLTLADAQIKKYESGLTDKELDNKIAGIEGELLPQEKPNKNLQNVIVDGYIFEIDRSVPTIADYIGPANSVVITAQIIQNGWSNSTASATVTGTIKKYGGGSVTNTTVTATNGVTIPSEFPTTGGSYTIPNIMTDTDITITASADDGKPAVTKKIEVRLIRDNTPPTISDAKVEARLMKIVISAKATDSESGLSSLTYTVTCPTGGTIKEGVTGSLETGVEKELTTTAIGNYTVTFTATDNANNPPTTVIANPVTTTNTLSVADAKRLVNSTSALREYVGTEVDYNSPEKGTWRVFYFDAEEKDADGTGKGVGYFGPKNTVYLKRDYDSTKTVNPWSSWRNKTPTVEAVNYMKQMNPKWRDYPSANANVVNLENEKQSAGFYEQGNYGNYRNPTYSSYAMGTPSVEMYMSAYNVWKQGNKDANALMCKVESANGYSVGALGTWWNNGESIVSWKIERGPNYVFLPLTGYVYLSSPSKVYSDKMIAMRGDVCCSEANNGYDWGFTPVVPLDL